MAELKRLSELIQARTQIDKKIATLVGRPAILGHVGEYVAAEIFGIVLEQSAAHKGIDGRFASGPLTGRTVNVKWYSQLEGLLDMNPDSHPDDYLVMTGPKRSPGSSR